MNNEPLVTVCRIIIAATAALLISAPVAHADPATDAHFIDMLQNSGFVLSDRDAAINNAHLVCTHLWAGDATTDDLAQQIDQVETNLDLSASKAFVAIAIQVYCPNIGARYQVAQHS